MFFSNQALAEWTLIADSNGDNFYMNLDSRKVNKDIVKVWEYQSWKVQKNGIFSMRALVQYDCKEETHKILNFDTFSGRDLSGELKSSFKPNSGWDPIPPDSAFMSMWKVACDRYK